jgi:hypothetical protein
MEGLMTGEFRLTKSSVDESGLDVVDPDGNRVAWGMGEYAIVAVRAINRYIDGSDAPDQPAEAPSAAAERIDNERFQAFRDLMTLAAQQSTATTQHYLGQAGLELLAEIEWLRSRLVAWDHDLSATTAEREEALEERDDARAALQAAQARADGYALLVGEYRAALLDQWESNHGEHCTWPAIIPCPRGDLCGWPMLAILAAEPEARAASLIAAQKESAP